MQLLTVKYTNMNDDITSSTTIEELLRSWSLTELLSHFQDEGIGIKELEMMKPHHIIELLHNYKLGIRVRFEHYFIRWRRHINKPLEDSTRSTYCETTPRPSPYTRSSVSPKRKRHQATNTESMALLRSEANTPTLPMQMQLQEDVVNEMPKLTPLPHVTEKVISTKTPPPLKILVSPEEPSKTTDTASIQVPTALAVLNTDSVKHSPLNLLQIMEASANKDKLLKYYKDHNSFTNTHRNLLMHMIVGFFDTNDYHLSLNMSHHLEREILQMFPTEKLEYYRTEKRGKIYTKYCNMKRYKRDKATLAKRARVEDDANVSVSGSTATSNDKNKTSSNGVKMVNYNSVDDDELQIKSEYLSDSL